MMQLEMFFRDPPFSFQGERVNLAGDRFATPSVEPIAGFSKRALYNAWRRKRALRKRAEKSHRGQRSAYLELRNAMTARLKAEIA